LFDIILDDASHLPDDQVATLEAFGGYLSDDGLFVIEDIDGKYQDTLQPRLEAAARRHGLDVIKWYDLRARSGRFDDIVATFSKSKSKSGSETTTLQVIQKVQKVQKIL
jgi:hypothetical protein